MHLGSSPNIPIIGSSTSSNGGQARGEAEGHGQLVERLQARLPEITGAILDRLHGMERDDPVRDVEYLESLGHAVHKGVRYGIEVLELGQERASPAPPAVTGHARLAARHRIPLETVIRRYLAGKNLLSDFLLEEASGLAGCGPNLLRTAMAAQDAAFERVISSATEEYRRETQARLTSRDSRLAERVQRLLDGESVDPSTLEYDLGAWHLGLVALSPDVRPLLRALSKEAGGRLLVVAPSEGETWAWLGSRDPIDPRLVSQWAERDWPGAVPLGVGEPVEALLGWRRTHEQARSAVGLTHSVEGSVVRYRDVALIAAAGRDPLLLASLRDMYLLPLAEEGDRADLLRQTLRAYFAADRNSSSAAAALGVSRQTVANRLQTVEERVGEPVSECADALHAALRLEELRVLRDSRS